MDEQIILVHSQLSYNVGYHVECELVVKSRQQKTIEVFSSREYIEINKYTGPSMKINKPAWFP